MQTSLHFSRPLAAGFLSLSGPARGRGLFCFLVGLLLLGSLQAQSQTQTFTCTGAPQSYTVPAGTTSLSVTVKGAAGSSRGSFSAGNGGTVTSILAVTPGETLHLYVGCQPTATAQDGGFNGGGLIRGTSSIVALYSAPGGGASDIRMGEVGNRVVVAGGGGGSGRNGGNGGHGGGSTGGNGGCNFVSGVSFTGAGGGGTQLASGSGGSITLISPPAGVMIVNTSHGFAGRLGGEGGWSDTTVEAGAGSGGGGYYGGGGGGTGSIRYGNPPDDPTNPGTEVAVGCGGGGGSSYTSFSVNSNVTSTQGDNSGNGSIQILACVTPTQFTVTGGGSYCPGTAGVAVGLSGSETSVTYRLLLNNVPTGAPVAGTGSAITFGNQTPTPLGSYTYTVEAVSCATSVTMTGNVAVALLPLTTASIAGNLAICQGTATTLTASGAGVGGSYRWSTNATSATTAAVSVSTAGNYSVTVTTASGCTATNSANITARTLPTVSIAALPSLSVCPGQSLTLTATATAGVPTGGGNRIATVVKPNSNEVMLNVGPAFSYTWSTGSNLQAISFTPTATTVVSVQVNDGFCTSLPRSTTVSNLTSPAVSIGTSAPALGCGITSITLTANGPVGATYAWEDASSTPTRVISASGTYGLSATATNGCSATATPVTIGTNGVLNTVITLVFGNSATVMGTGIPTITVPATPGQQFQVFGGSGYEFVAVLDRINGYEVRQRDENSTGIFTIKQGGPFSITVRDGNGCSRTVQGVIVVRQ